MLNPLFVLPYLLPQILTLQPFSAQNNHNTINMETITYSQVGSLDIQLDLYLPPELNEGLVQAVVHFHGGGMIAGCRKTLYFQNWLKGRSCKLYLQKSQ